MDSGIRLRRLACAIAFAWLLPHAAALAQPHGWPCDLALRPGNAWYYRTTIPGYEFFQDSVARDSIGTDGSYWVEMYPRNGASLWYRFTIDCDLYKHYAPDFIDVRLWLKPLADTGTSWTVEPPPHNTIARVKEYFYTVLFGLEMKTQRVMYFEGDSGQAWWFTADYAAGIGRIHEHDHYNTYDLIGAVIDGVHYGITSDVLPHFGGSTNDLEAHIVDGGAAIAVTVPTRREGSVNVAVADLMGRTVAEQTVEPDAVPGTRLLIPTAGLASGPYFVTARAGTEVRTARILLIR